MPGPLAFVRKGHCSKWGPAPRYLEGTSKFLLTAAAPLQVMEKPTKGQQGNSCQATDPKRHLSAGRPAGHYPTETGVAGFRGSAPLSTALQATVLGSSTLEV